MFIGIRAIAYAEGRWWSMLGKNEEEDAGARCLTMRNEDGSTQDLIKR